MGTKESRAQEPSRVRDQETGTTVPLVDHDYFALVVSVPDWDHRNDQLEAPGESGSPRPASHHLDTACERLITATSPAGRQHPSRVLERGSVHRAPDSPAE